MEKYKDFGDERLVVKISHGKNQYYKKSSKSKLEYLALNRRRYASQLAQKSYYEDLLKELFIQKKCIRRFLNNYKANVIVRQYEELCDGRKKLVEPIILPNEDYIKHWNEKYTGGQNGYQINNGIKTNKGEMVRSKSEKILADLFYKYDIPYQYEPAVKLDNGKTVFPDFVLLNIAERKTYYWEHFGLASDDEYTMKNLDKLYYYEKSGIIVGDNLILSIESEHNALDVTLVEKQIKEHLL
ncbi:MAG: hypothetical protein K6E79_09065 [Pseudobutyrivibrio sp.]|nr:hypothetical protein [Pseudobutyrivibrio sp.]